MSRRWSKFRSQPSPQGDATMSRRAFLSGAGTLLALPWLESILPTGSRAWAAKSSLPTRLLCYYVPNGMHMPAFTPQDVGSNYTLSSILEPLSAHQPSINVLSGLANLAAKDNVAGDHARGTGSFLTCAPVFKTEGDGIQNGISIDQVAAQAMGSETTYPSLQLGISGGASVGDCDSGYSCAYSRNISWSSATTPLPKVTNPRLAFDRLFANFDESLSTEALARRRAYRLSKLDALVEDSLSLRARLGASDAHKLDEYLTGVRELEVRVMNAEASMCSPGEAPPNAYDYPLHVELMTNIMVKAFQCDLTRVISFMLNNAGSNRNYDFLGVSGAHHEISHHQDIQENFDKLTTIGTWEVSQFAMLLDGLAAVAEGDGNLLDQSLLFFSSEIADGNAHQHVNLPVILAGSGGGAIPTGRHISMPQSEQTPIADLFISMVNAMGVAMTSFGLDGTGPLSALEG